jgi:starch phosphorylase
MPLYLLDTNLQENSPADREITSRLYGGGTEMRIKQEIVLGIGGVRALEALNIVPTVFHMNEGHSAFLALERIRVLLESIPLTFDEARQEVMATSVFTTHTPVPAGIDMFPPDLMVKYFQELYSLALKLDEKASSPWAAKMSATRSRAFRWRCWRSGWPTASTASAAARRCEPKDVAQPLAQVPPMKCRSSTSPTASHVRTWLSPDIAFTLDRYLGDDWMNNPADQSVWEGVSQIPDEELWRAHERCRERLVGWTRQTLREQLTAAARSYDDVALADEVLDPEALTIGFARRFATYKRGALLLRDPEPG